MVFVVLIFVNYIDKVWDDEVDVEEVDKDIVLGEDGCVDGEELYVSWEGEEGKEVKDVEWDVVCV